MQVTTIYLSDSSQPLQAGEEAGQGHDPYTVTTSDLHRRIFL